MKKHEFYIEDTSNINSSNHIRYLIRHKGCNVAGDNTRDWGSYGDTCTGCDIEIPNYLIVQRDLLNGSK